MKLIFEDTEDFAAYHRAESWCHENGYSTGSMCAPLPTAIKKGDYNISKWKNLSKAEIKAIDGTIKTIGIDFRSGPIELTIYE